MMLQHWIDVKETMVSFIWWNEIICDFLNKIENTAKREPMCFTETKLMKQLIYAIKRKWIILGS